MIRRPPRSTLDRSSAASDVYKRQVLRRVLLLAAVGLAIGVPVALGGFRLVKSLLFQTQPNDPGALALAGVAVLSAAVLAGWAPARRASRIDPLVALRHD